MKRKNLYHIQKHYVNIQIPRKGYFYRSTLHLKAPDPPVPRQRLEPAFMPKNESQIQISRVATTSFKISNIFKKRMKQSDRMKCSSSTGKPGKDIHTENILRRPRRNQENSNSVPNGKPLRPRVKIIISKAAKSSFIPKYRNRLSSIVTQKLIRANLLQEVGSDLSLKQSSFLGGEQEGANSVTNENITPKRVDRKSKISCFDGVQTKKKIIKAKESDGVSESSLSESPRKPKKKSVGDDMPRRPIKYNLLSFSSDNEADQSSDASEPDCAVRNFSQRKDTNDEKWLNINSLTSLRSIEEKIAQLETPNENLDAHLSNFSLECLPDEIAFDKENFNANYDTVEELVDVINTFENFNIAFPKKTFVYQALVKRSDSHKKEKKSFVENKNNLENIVTAKLMGDIDLHLELENYLKAISASDETVSCKVRTKNTLQQNHVNCAKGENTDFEGSNIIENKLGISISAGELNSFENSENTNEKEISMRTDSGSGRLFNEAKIKSSSSFKSAISICTPPSSPRNRNVENQFFVFLDRKIENFPMSQEYMDLKPTKDCASHIFSQFLEESKIVKKIRSENDASILQHDIKSKSHIKRTVGEISLQPPQWDATPPILQSVKVQNSFPISLLKDIQGEPRINLYEKISPLEPYCEGKLKPNTRSSVLFKNSFYSTSADSLKPNTINIECESVKLCTNISPMRISSKYKFGNSAEEIIEEQEQSEYVLSERIITNKSPDDSIKSQTSLTTLNSSTENWSPSLQELIEIYNSVLKQNKKIRRCNINRVKRSISSYLISFIHDKIKEKMHKKELINYAKERVGDSKLKIEEISNIYEGESTNPEKKNFFQLVEYVNRFQEVLSSSLSINQITRLNNLMAGLQDPSLENKTPSKIVNKKKSTKIKKVANEKKGSIVSSQSKPKSFKSDRRVKKITDVRETISFRTNKLQKRNAFKNTANDKLKSVKEVKLPPSAELESVLKSYLTNPKTTVGKDSQLGKSASKSSETKKNKFLVNVKLCENKIIVNGMRQFKSEKALPKAPLPPAKETSDLIIESVSDKQIENLKCSPKGKSSKSFNLNKNINNKKKFKKPEVKTSKQGTHRSKAGGKLSKKKSEEMDSEEDGMKTRESVSDVRMEGIASTGKIFQDEELFINKYEYDHNQLKIQHPIEAIIESSESKISEKTVDDYNELSLNQEESKYHVEGEIIKYENYILSDKDINILKSLTNNSIFSNVGSGEEPSVPLQRTISSYLEESSQIKNRILTDLEKNFSRKKIAKFTKPADATNTVSPQSCKKSAPKKKKMILASRPRSTYLCYPYLQCIQSDKMTKNKKVGKNRKSDDKSASSSREGTVLKTDSSKRAQIKTKVLKNISKGLSNLFKRTSERREQSKTSKSRANPTTKTTLEKKHENSKISENIIDYQVSNTKVEQDDQSRELISFNENGFDNGSSLIVQNRSFVSLTSSERSAQEPKSSESDKHSISGAFGGCSNMLKKENPEENHSEYCNLKGVCNCGVEEEEEDGEKIIRVKRSFTSQNSSATTDSYKRPTIVIHARNEGSDDVSFPSLMVLSESFLKCYSNFALSRTKIKSLFKSHSEMKFYPGRVVDNPEEQTPFVTFVLTPKQKDEAGIPDYQTKIVTKPKASEEELKKEIKEEDFHVNFEQITHQNSLRAIELFIETLSESRKKACKLQMQDEKTKKESQNVPKKLYVTASKPCPKKYKFAPCRRLQALFASKRKPYHECQKRLIANKIENSKKGTFKKYPVSGKTKNFKSTNTMNITQIPSRHTSQSQEDEWKNSRENKSHNNSEMMKTDVHEEKNIEDNSVLTTTMSRCISQKEPNSVSDDSTPNEEQNEVNVLPKYLDQLKTAKKRTESFKNNKKIIETIDEYHKALFVNDDPDATERNHCSCNSEYDSEWKMQMTKNDKKMSPVGNVRNCKSVDSSGKQMKGINNSKKLKNKIHCTQSNSNNPETQENTTPEISAEISDGERELLDSLLLKERGLEKLERKPSIYFDAEESERENKSGKTDEQRFQVSFNSPNSWSFSHRSFLQSPSTEVGNVRPTSGYTNRPNEAYYYSPQIKHSFTKRKRLRTNSSTKLGDTVPLLKKKGKNLMTNKMENRWRRILSLLDDVSKEMEKSSEEESDDEGAPETKAMILNSKKPESKISKVFNFLKKQALDRTKTFLSKVKAINPTIDEGRECVQGTSFPSQNSFRIVEGFQIKSHRIKFSLTTLNEVFSKLLDYLSPFKTKLNTEPENVETETKLDNSESDTKISSNQQELPVALYQSKSENLCGTNSSSFLVHQANKMFNIPEALSEFSLNGDESNDGNTLLILKQRIRKQRLLIQYLTKFSALPNIQFIINKIIKRLGMLEKVLTILEKTMEKTAAKCEKPRLFENQ